MTEICADLAKAAAVQAVRRKSLRTIRNPNGASGRNDPCQCGSGRKWKNCCRVKALG